MIFEESKTVEKAGRIFGYIFSYFLFTTILYLILLLLKSSYLTYFSVMGITMIIALTGVIVKNLLK